MRLKVGPNHPTPLSVCLSCGSLLSSANHVDEKEDHKPCPGGISICMECGHIMAFADDLTFRELTKEEQIGIAGNPKLLAVQRARMLADYYAAHVEDAVRELMKKHKVKVEEDELERMVERAFAVMRNMRQSGLKR